MFEHNCNRFELVTDDSTFDLQGTARAGLKRLVKTGALAPSGVLASPELLSVTRAYAGDIDDVELALLATDAIRRAIESLDEPSVAHALLIPEELGPPAPIGDRRAAAAANAGVTTDSFRVRREAVLVADLARHLLVQLGGSRSVALHLGARGGIDADTERMCPFHGGYVKLAECLVISSGASLTLDAIRKTRGPVSADALRESHRTDESPGAGGLTRDFSIRPGDVVTSNIDGISRDVLAVPQRSPATTVTRRRIGSRRRGSPPLLSAFEMAGSKNLARRPARACQVCMHPLPSTIDDSQPFTVVIAGRPGASKTSLVLALIVSLQREGSDPLGLKSLVLSEISWHSLLEDLHRWGQGEAAHGTTRGYTPPVELVADGGDGHPVSILIQDGAGEDFDADTRLSTLPMILWADAIVFVYDPERLTSHEYSGYSADQSVLLNGIIGDVRLRGSVDADGRTYGVPRLFVAVSKADLLPPSVLGDASSDTAARAALSDLGDRGFVAAADQRQDAEWALIAPAGGGGESFGVAELFRRVFSPLQKLT